MGESLGGRKCHAGSLLSGAGGVDGGVREVVFGRLVVGDQLALAVLGRAHLVLSEEGVRVAQHECLAEDLIHVLDHHDAEGVEHALRDLLEVILVLLRNQNDVDLGSVRREELLFQATDGQHAAAQRDLARHRDVFANGNLE